MTILWVVSLSYLPAIFATFPIIERGTKADEINACIKSSRILGPRVETLHLRTNMHVHRFQDASAGAHAELLLRIGNGQIPINPTISLITMPCGHLIPTLEQLEENVFPSLSQNFQTSSGYQKELYSPQQTSQFKLLTKTYYTNYPLMSEHTFQLTPLSNWTMP